MSGDSTQLVDDAEPHIVWALSVYGGAVLTRTVGDAVNGTVGRRLTRRIFGTRREGDPVPKVLADVIQDPADPAHLGALRAAMHQALAADGHLADQVRAILASSGPRTATSAPQPLYD